MIVIEHFDNSVSAEWDFSAGDLSIRFDKEGLFVEGFYFSDAGDRNNNIGPAFITWEQFDELRKRVV